MNMNLEWAVVNRSNDIKIASFAGEADANAYAVARNDLARAIGISDEPWFVTKNS